ncbi:hypothetical protein DPMN_102540 [Dreissena polymorpha]|uniref:Uncharacterized protein n=1 Tax=Dreissena polymorpha TaxID=45954 RepID=A0A9D4LJI7_DREPO|nr:hypothetical protein DPMN_102540 [Dreissena polymorpha]
MGDCASTSTALHPVGIVLKSADPSQCADFIPVLPSINKIILRNVTCSFSWQRSLLSSLLTLNHEVMCTLLDISIECEDGAKRIRRADINKGLNNSFRINIEEDSPNLLKALHGLNIKTLCLREDLDVHHSDLSKVFSSLTHLETLSIETLAWFVTSYLWKALHGLNIKTLCLRSALEDLAMHHVIECSQSLSSLTHLETLCIDLCCGSSLLWKALHGLNIKSLRMGAMSGGLNVEHVECQSQSLSSLTHLETLSITARFDSPGLWKALHGLNIKSLSIDQKDLNVDDVESLSAVTIITHTAGNAYTACGYI